MKHSNYILIILAFSLVFLIGCQDKQQNNILPQPEIEADTKLIEAAASDSIDTDGMTKLREFSFDLDLDNVEEKIELYTAAERNEKGEMLWDDGQNWVLLVHDGEKAYPLLSQYVQLGSVYFTVSNSGEGQISNINVIVSTDSSFRMMSYVFDKENNGYNEELLYESKDNNWSYSSIPGY